MNGSALASSLLLFGEGKHHTSLPHLLCLISLQFLLYFSSHCQEDLFDVDVLEGTCFQEGQIVPFGQSPSLFEGNLSLGAVAFVANYDLRHIFGLFV
jgi:hypothetical protein